MEAPLHQLPPPPQEHQDALLRQAVAAHAMMMTSAVAAASQHQQPAMMGREQCPRCASRDTKFCYYNNYNTAQPRHFCRACRRYWTLGGSLRNVPVGGSTRKRHHRPARPTRAIAAATSGSAGGSSSSSTTTAAGAGLLGSLLLGSPLLALGAAPLLEGRLGTGQPPALLAAGGGAAGDVARHQLREFGGAGPTMPWPAGTVLDLEGHHALFPLPPSAAALWQELAAVEAGSGGGLLLHHGGSSAPQLLM